MNFETNRILTGIVPKVSKKTGEPYVILNFLNNDGSTFSSMVDNSVTLPDGLKQLSNCKVKFQITFYNGNVTGLKTVGLDLVK